MGIYETTYILHPALQEGRLNDIVNTIEKKAVSLGADILERHITIDKKLEGPDHHCSDDPKSFKKYILPDWYINFS